MAPSLRRIASQQIRQRMPEEDVVAEHERDVVIADEVASDDEGLRETFRLRLHRVIEVHTEVRAVAEEVAIERRRPAAW